MRELLHQQEGPLTRELLRRPGRFGLGQVPARLAPERTTSLVCGFCATGCALSAHLRDGQAVNLSPVTDYPVNLGMACPKGWEALAPLEAEDRATTPLLRGADGRLAPVDWDTALGSFVERMRGLRDAHGGEALAFLSTGQIPTEEMLFLGTLARFGMGMAWGDGNTRQCMATAVTAYKEAFGFDAPPYTYADLEESDVIVLVGSNLCIAHPILWERICRNPNQPQVIVLDPRRTETAMAASWHLPLAPKSDLPLLYAVARELLAQGFVDRDFVEAHTEDFEAFTAHLEPFTLEAAERASGLSSAEIEWLARCIGEGKRVSFWWTMGVNQGHEAVRVAQALINLALMTGNLGRPGTGANSITGQCNAMGSRLFSNTTNLLGGHDFADEAHRSKVAGLLGIDEACIPRSAGLAYDEIVEGIEAGRIKGLWVVATNGAHSWIEQERFRAALRKLEFLVVQDMYTSTETAQLAHLVLPAAGWGEKDGTFINSERRIGLVKKVRRAPGQALSDFRIFRALAAAWGLGAPYDTWKQPEDVFGVMRELSRGQPCDFGGIEGYAMLDECGGIQWPLPEGTAPESERRLFADGAFHRESGRARFCFETPRPPAEEADARHPFVLLTGRGSSSQWHTQTRTGKSAVLRRLHRPGLWLEISPEDAEPLGIRPDDRVRVRSRRGCVEARAVLSATVGRGRVFMPMHEEATNQLTLSSFDPYSRQPSYKHCAVSVERISD